MISPSISELTKGKFNKYELVIVTAKAARMVTDNYVIQREYADRKVAQKEISCAAEAIDPELRDVKAVKNAIIGIYNGKFKRACDVAEEDAAAAEKATEETAEETAEESPAEEAAEETAEEKTEE